MAPAGRLGGPPRPPRHPQPFTNPKHSRNVAPVASANVDVVLVRWPAEAVRRAQLALRQLPRLLLLEDNAVPPQPADCLEDWIRVPATEIDVRSRCSALAARADQHVSASPTLDDDGVLRFGGIWVPLPPVEARLTDALLQRFGAVVSRDGLARAGWPDGAPGRNALDVHVLRLRRRIQPLGLAIRTVRSRGYLLEGLPSAAMVPTALEA
jgi:Transcriptional regulatory protein, C terminal